MKKRIIALLLLLLFVVSLTGCGFRGCVPIEREEPPKETHARATIATVEESTRVITEATTEATEETENESADTDIGVVDGNTYTNRTIGIVCTLPEGWYVYNETDLASLNNLVGSMLDGTAIANAIENNQAVVIFCASEPTAVSSLNVTVTKNPLPVFDEETMINMTVSQVEAQLAQTGMQNISCGTSTVNFCGEEHTVLTVSGEAYGMPLYEKILILHCGNYLYSVTASAYQEDTTVPILDYFKPLD